MTLRDNRDYSRVLLYSYHTTITGWGGVLLSYGGGEEWGLLRRPVFFGGRRILREMQIKEIPESFGLPPIHDRVYLRMISQPTQTRPAKALEAIPELEACGNSELETLNCSVFLDRFCKGKRCSVAITFLVLSRE